MPFSFQRPKFSKLTRGLRAAYNFDGVDDMAHLADRAINPDVDIDIEWVSGPSVNFSTSRTIISQTTTTNANAQELFIFVSTGAGIVVRVGGSVVGINGVTYSANTKYRFLLQGTIIKFWVNDLLVTEQNFTRGTVREPTAVTVIGAAVSNFFYFGALYNVRINGTLWPISEKDYAIQLPAPSGLGEELIPTSVLENPVSKGSQWTYLGAGRWQYVGDGTLNELRFLAAANCPPTGLIDFEVESISGTMTWLSANNVGSQFGTIGRKRFFYPSFPADGISFKRAVSTPAASCIIKNISFKPLGTCNPMILVNTTSDRWQEV